MKASTDELLDSYAAKDEQFKAILDSQRKFMKKARKWTIISDYNYIKTTIEVEK